jgi:hypothetical protein
MPTNRNHIRQATTKRSRDAIKSTSTMYERQ